LIDDFGLMIDNRNIKRFLADFMFQLSEKEWENLISQNATSSCKWKFLIMKQKHFLNLLIK